MKVVFWISAAVIVYTYAGYPLWLYLRRQWRTQPIRLAPIHPSVSVVMAVRNEAEALPRKLRNLMDLDYPPDRCEIIVISDGSTDATDQIMASQASERVRMLRSERHEGKAAALNLGMGAAKGEIVVFTDARQLIDPGAIVRLVASFADPSVGCVSGELMLGKPDSSTTAGGVGLYWRMEKRIRQWESDAGSVIGATGALYAVRRELLFPIPRGTILDDVYLPLLVARQGARVVFEPQARAYDRIGAGRTEFRRKVRTLTGNYQLLRLAPWLLTRSNPLLFDYISHKLLRLLVPFALVAILISSWLLQGVIYELARVLQIAFYASGALALLRLRLGLVSRLADASLAFVELNTAAALAFVYFVTGKKEVWVR